ncbi:MAG: hypothetical protein ACJ8F7_13860 [Gemmataceae bacterium]
MCFRKTLLPLVVVTGVTGCGQHPRLDVSVSIVDGRVAFDIPRRDVNGLLAFRVENANGTILWHIEMNYEKRRQIIYGVLPASGKQTVPSDGSVPADIRGREVRVRVEYQYDEFAAPSAGEFVKTVQVP